MKKFTVTVSDEVAKRILNSFGRMKIAEDMTDPPVFEAATHEEVETAIREQFLRSKVVSHEAQKASSEVHATVMNEEW